MDERRELKRYRKRLQLRFGPEGPSRVGFTEDLSDTGIFLRSTFVFRPNTVLHVALSIHAPHDVIFTGRVMWARKVPPNLMNKIRGGMGVRILSFDEGEGVYQALISSFIKG